MLRNCFVFSAIVTIVAIGCSQPAATPIAKKNTKDALEPHAHKPSAHGGTIIEIGQDNYHAEVVFEKNGAIQLYMLGHDEGKIMEIAVQQLSAFAKADGASEAESFSFEPAPQPGDKNGMTSRFRGVLPQALIGKTVEVTIQNVKIGEERFRIAFTNQTEAGGHDMPAKVADEAERKLYLTAGGKYTEADIKANGSVTASEKFKGFRAEHDLKPKPGDKICPVTMTKANPKCAWIIGGKTYEFCCPPCVDEFVQAAKDTPDAIKQPEEYRKQ